VKAAALGIQAARDLAKRAEQEKLASDKALADARSSSQQAAATVASLKKNLDQAKATRAAAEKALAEKRAPLEDAKAKEHALKAELDALATELKRPAPAAKGGLAAAATTTSRAGQ
jgi:hypothetical protein